MSVQVVQGGGGFLDSLLGAAQMASMFVPGMQAFTPFIGAARSLANGDVGGAAGSLIIPGISGAMNAGKAAAATSAANRDSLFGALTDAHQRENGWENYAEGLQQSSLEREIGEYLKTPFAQTDFRKKWR